MGDDREPPTEEPEVPDSLPTYLVEGVLKQDADTLRDLAAYASVIADWREAEAERKLEANAEHSTDTVPDEWDEDEWAQQFKKTRNEAT